MRRTLIERVLTGTLLQPISRCHQKIQITSPCHALGLAALLLVSGCNGTRTPETLAIRTDTPAPTRTVVVIPPATLTPTAARMAPNEPATPPTPVPTATSSPVPTPTPTREWHAEPEASLARVTPSPTLTRPPTPRPTKPPVETPLPLPQDEVSQWHLPGSAHIVAMRDTIASVLRTNELEFDLGYPVQGFSPDPIYPRIFIRDTSTLIAGASYFYPAERLRWNVEAFLRQQYDEMTVSSEDGRRSGFGAISATVGPDGIVDKATVVSDEDTHLIHAAYVVYRRIGGAAWLSGEIDGLPIITRLNAAGDWLLAQRRDEATGLIKRDHTTDWGDVRFQTAEGNPTDILNGDVIWTASIYDQAIAYRAWRELATMNRAVGDETAASRWQAEADALRHATNAHLWQAERGFYLTHLHLTPLAHDFDEGSMVSVSNAVAVICGLTDPAQDAAIMDALERARLEAGAGKPGLVLFPPYPEAFFAPSFLGPGRYQNGGVWDWWGGWQVLAEFESGFSQMARTHLSQTAADWARHPGQIFEWQEVTSLAGHGGDRYAGAAGTYAQAVIEGLYGVSLSLAGPTLSPRLGDWPGGITVRQPANGFYLRYTYQPEADRLALTYETRHQAPTFPLHLLLPPGFEPEQVRLDGVPLAWERLSLGQDTYLTADLPTGHHALVVVAVIDDF